MNSNLKTAIFWVVLILLVVVFVTVVRTGQRGPDRNLTFTQFVHDVTDHKVKEVTVSGMEVHGTYTDGAAFHTMIPERYPEIIIRARSVDEMSEIGCAPRRRQSHRRWRSVPRRCKARRCRGSG